jgi:hypothetical protein
MVRVEVAGVQKPRVFVIVAKHGVVALNGKVVLVDPVATIGLSSSGSLSISRNLLTEGTRFPKHARYDAPQDDARRAILVLTSLSEPGRILTHEITSRKVAVHDCFVDFYVRV